MSLYEHWSDKYNYIYFKKQGQPSLPGKVHEIACSPNFHKALEFIIITAGRQPASINGNRIVGEAGDLLFVDSLQPHSYSETEGVDGYILVLSEEYLSGFRTFYGNLTWPKLLNEKDANKPIIEYIKFWYKNQDGTPYEKFNRANEFFAMLTKVYPPRSMPRERTNEIVIDMLNYIDENYEKSITMNIMADQLGYAKQYCSKIFNKIVDESFRKYLNRVRILKFEQLWEENKNKNKNKNSVLELAFACGFDSQSTFYRAYRELNGTTPKLR